MGTEVLQSSDPSLIERIDERVHAILQKQQGTERFSTDHLEIRLRAIEMQQVRTDRRLEELTGLVQMVAEQQLRNTQQIRSLNLRSMEPMRRFEKSQDSAAITVVDKMSSWRKPEGHLGGTSVPLYKSLDGSLDLLMPSAPIGFSCFGAPMQNSSSASSMSQACNSKDLLMLREPQMGDDWHIAVPRLQLVEPTPGRQQERPECESNGVTSPGLRKGFSLPKATLMKLQKYRNEASAVAEEITLLPVTPSMTPRVTPRLTPRVIDPTSEQVLLRPTPRATPRLTPRVIEPTPEHQVLLASSSTANPEPLDIVCALHSNTSVELRMEMHEDSAADEDRLHAATMELHEESAAEDLKDSELQTEGSISQLLKEKSAVSPTVRNAYETESPVGAYSVEKASECFSEDLSNKCSPRCNSTSDLQMVNSGECSEKERLFADSEAERKSLVAALEVGDRLLARPLNENESGLEMQEKEASEKKDVAEFVQASAASPNSDMRLHLTLMRDHL